MEHKIIAFNFTSLVPDDWASFPDFDKLKRQLATAVLAHSELTTTELGLYAPPAEIREVKITAAAADQIRCMWHGHRRRGQNSPPTIPLKIFVFAGGQNSAGSWASVEIFPGVDNWDVV
jgi:hypothetical protein